MPNVTEQADDKRISALVAEIETRFARVRAGVDIGFADPALSRIFRTVRGGVWMTVEQNVAMRDHTAAALDAKSVLTLGPRGELPFEDFQFDVVVLADALFARDRDWLVSLVRETHRILQGGGCLVFSVDAARAGGTGPAEKEIYELLRDGFDVISLRRPPWWNFGRSGHLLTVCARRKNWRNRRTTVVRSSVPVSTAMLSSRERRSV